MGNLVSSSVSSNKTLRLAQRHMEGTVLTDTYWLLAGTCQQIHSYGLGYILIYMGTYGINQGKEKSPLKQMMSFYNKYMEPK